MTGDRQVPYCIDRDWLIASEGALGNIDCLDADMYLRRAAGTLITNQRAVPKPIKCATSKS